MPDAQSWDSDGDHRYAEDLDEIDYYNEISVGRLPFGDPETVLQAARAAVDFEQEQSPAYKRNILLAREMLDDEQIPIFAEDTGGFKGRKLIFDTYSGVVKIKKING